MEKELKDKIVNHQLHNVDKFYRMFAGLSSMLDDYVDGTIYLTIHKNSRWKKDDLTTARQLAGDWKGFNRELKNAEKYQVTIIHEETPTGFAIDLAQVADPSDVTAIAEAFKAATQPAARKTPSKCVVVSGYFQGHMANSAIEGGVPGGAVVVSTLPNDSKQDSNINDASN